MDAAGTKIIVRLDWNRRFDRADDADGADATYPTTYAPSGRRGMCAVVRGHLCCRRACSENRQPVRAGERGATPRASANRAALAAFAP
jgi:hypothetical protein